MFLKPHSNRNKIHKIEPNIAGSFLGLPSSEALISGHRPFDTVWNGAPKYLHRAVTQASLIAAVCAQCTHIPMAGRQIL